MAFRGSGDSLTTAGAIAVYSLRVSANLLVNMAITADILLRLSFCNLPHPPPVRYKEHDTYQDKYSVYYDRAI